jgi:hypothetical protein
MPTAAQAATLFAHYFAGRGRKYLVITKTPATSDRVMEIEVEGKVDARKQAAFYGARAWNF